MSGHGGKSSVLKVALNLTAACIISGLIIAVAYAITNPAAEIQREKMKDMAMRGLVPAADKFVDVQGKTGWFAAVKDGQTVAYEIPSESKGYGGAIKMIVAVGIDGKVIGYTILSANETPGLGDNANKSSFKDRFVGKALANLEDKDGNPLVEKVPSTDHVQALTGATITSKAVVRAVSEAVKLADEFINNGKSVTKNDTAHKDDVQAVTSATKSVEHTRHLANKTAKSADDL
ncbi:MAG: FMN-binding protein [Negativicutes bacterium]